MAASDNGAIAAGLVLVVVAGFLNGSWNASFSPTWGLAVGRKSTVETLTLGRRRTITRRSLFSSENDVDLDYHYSWVLFQIYASIINIPVCLYWAGGPKQVSYIVSESSATSIALVIVFSVLWGVGSVGFGLACRIAGVGLGTNLTMGFIMMIGTFLPLALEGLVLTDAGGVIVGGLVICCVGLYYSMKSLQTRDLDEQQTKKQTMESSTEGTSASAAKASEETVSQEVMVEEISPSGDYEANAEETVPQELTVEEISPSGEYEANAQEERAKEETCTNTEETYSTMHKVTVCVIAAIFASQLQFAFVFGQDMIDLAGDDAGPGATPPSGTAAVIWLFAIPMGAPASIAYGLYSSPPQIPFSTMWRCPWYRHVLIILTTSVPWVTHIHLYGLANTYLPDDLGASVAWPVLMMTTVVAGFLWSIGLGEWTKASVLARRQLRMGLFIVTIGLITIMSSVALS
jgi:hypothetical protein